MPDRFDPLRVLEAAYAADPEEAWLRGLAEAFAPLARGAGIVAISCRLDGWRLTEPRAAVLDGPEAPVDAMSAVWTSAPPEAVRAWFQPTPPVDTQLGRLRRGAPVEGTPLSAPTPPGLRDALGVLGLDPSGHAVLVHVPSPQPVRVAPRLLHRLTLVSAHLAAARRLRAAAELGVEAVLDPSGQVHHAEGEARDAEARASLARAVTRAERARGRLRREDPDGALALWRGLVDGRWSLVDQVEADGRRLLLARRNPPGVRDPRALSARERDVVAHVAQGHGNKHVAYALGLSATTVATHLQRALAKLGLRDRRDLIGLFEAAARSGRA